MKQFYKLLLVRHSALSFKRNVLNDHRVDHRLVRYKFLDRSKCKDSLHNKSFLPELAITSGNAGLHNNFTWLLGVLRLPPVMTSIRAVYMISNDTIPNSTKPGAPPRQTDRSRLIGLDVESNDSCLGREIANHRRSEIRSTRR